MKENMAKAKLDILRLLSDNAIYKERRRGLKLLLFFLLFVVSNILVVFLSYSLLMS